MIKKRNSNRRSTTRNNYNKGNNSNSNSNKNKNDNNISNPDLAAELVIQPYITEKTFNMIERENKLTFIVSEKATKRKIAESLEVLYESEVTEVNTSRMLRGKKAIVKFASPEGARDLATKLGLV